MNSIIDGLRRFAAKATQGIVRIFRGALPVVKSGLANRETGRPFTDATETLSMVLIERLEGAVGIAFAPARRRTDRLGLA